MKAILPVLATTLSCFAEDLTFTNRILTFTNLQGKAFVQVELVRADLDGLIWRSGSMGGRVCYTNLDPLLLESLGIPTNRIKVAQARAESRAESERKARLVMTAEAQAQQVDQAKAAAQEEAAAQIRALAQQKQADAEAISALDAQIATARARLRRAKAMAHDYNAANHYNHSAPRLFVREVERAKIDEAEILLKKMKQDFALKYKDRRAFPLREGK